MLGVIAISGPIAVGKSTFVNQLERHFKTLRISTRALIQSRRSVPSERGPLQAAGDDLDRETDGRWVADGVLTRVAFADADALVVVDSVRIPKQIEHLRNQFGDRFWHIHLTASEATLTERFQVRKRSNPAVSEFSTYAEAQANATESDVSKLTDTATWRIDTERTAPADLPMLVVEELGKLNSSPSTVTPLVDVVVGGQYGSEGKGNICDYLVKHGGYAALVRVGGPNAGHKVADPKYDYVHLPSGSQAASNTKILIGAGATLDVERVCKEIDDLKLGPDRLSIDPQAIVIEPSDRDYEAALAGKIGSTRKGVGVATARKIVGRDSEEHLGARVRLAREVPELSRFVRSVTAELEQVYLTERPILLEGTQGTDLSIHHGPYPKVTSRETSASGCLADAGISPLRVRRIYMVTRTYPIRVGGDSGPMGIEIDFETIAGRSGLPVEEIRKTEVGTISGKTRRIAEFSWERVRYAAQLNGATDIVLTFVDYLDKANRNATKFDDLTPETKAMIDRLERVTGVPVTLIAVGFGRDKIIDRRK